MMPKRGMSSEVQADVDRRADRGGDRIVAACLGDVEADRRQQVDALEEHADCRPGHDAGARRRNWPRVTRPAGPRAIAESPAVISASMAMP